MLTLPQYGIWCTLSAPTGGRVIAQYWLSYEDEDRVWLSPSRLEAYAIVGFLNAEERNTILLGTYEVRVYGTCAYEAGTPTEAHFTPGQLWMTDHNVLVITHISDSGQGCGICEDGTVASHLNYQQFLVYGRLIATFDNFYDAIVEMQHLVREKGNS